MPDIEDIKDEDLKSYEKTLIAKGRAARTAEKFIADANPNYLTNPIPENISLNELPYYIMALHNYGYISQYTKRYAIYNIRSQELNQAFLIIESDSRVAILLRNSIINFLDIYFFFRTFYSLFNILCASELKQDKTGNWFFPIAINALNFEEKQPESSKFKNQLKAIQDEMLYLPLKQQFERFLKNNSSVDSAELKRFFELVFSGDFRKVEKYYLSKLYSCLILKNEIGTEHVGKPTPTKRALLYSLLPIIIPQRHFLSEEEVIEKDAKDGEHYNGSYYQYKINTVKSILGE